MKDTTTSWGSSWLFWNNCLLAGVGWRLQLSKSCVMDDRASSTHSPSQPLPRATTDNLVLTVEWPYLFSQQGLEGLRRLIFKHCTLKIGTREMKKNSIKRKWVLFYCLLLKGSGHAESEIKSTSLALSFLDWSIGPFCSSCSNCLPQWQEPKRESSAKSSHPHSAW